MNVYIITSNVYLYFGISELVKIHLNSINLIRVNDFNFLNSTATDDLIIFHLDKHASFHLPLLQVFNRTSNVLILNSDKLKYEAIFDVNNVLNTHSTLEEIMSMIISKGRSTIRKKYRILSEKERTVLTGILQGLDVDKIAQRLKITSKTIYAHKRNALIKLEARKIHDIFHLKACFFCENYIF